MAEVVVVIGPGLIGQAIGRRVGVGKHIILAGLRRENAEAAAEVMSNAGYDVSVATVDVSSREEVHALIQNAAGRGEITASDTNGIPFQRLGRESGTVRLRDWIGESTVQTCNSEKLKHLGHCHHCQARPIRRRSSSYRPSERMASCSG